jgi:hypothetical protein
MSRLRLQGLLGRTAEVRQNLWAQWFLRGQIADREPMMH